MVERGDGHGGGDRHGAGGAERAGRSEAAHACAFRKRSATSLFDGPNLVPRRCGPWQCPEPPGRDAWQWPGPVASCGKRPAEPRRSALMPTVDRVLPWRRTTAPRPSRSSRWSAPTGAGTRRPRWSCSPGPTNGPATRTQGQIRKSGEPYIQHPLAVARIVAELGLDDATIAAALLHDAVEDTGITLADLEARVRRRRGRHRRRGHQARPDAASTPRRRSRPPPCARCWWRWRRTSGS